MIDIKYYKFRTFWGKKKPLIKIDLVYKYNGFEAEIITLK